MLLLTLAMVLPTLWPRLFPSLYASDLYRQFEHNPHIQATDIRNFRVCYDVGSSHSDTLLVDVTLLHADTDSAWYALLYYFGMSQEAIDYYQANSSLMTGEDYNSLLIFYIDRNNPTKRSYKDDPESWLVLGSFAQKTICFFMTENNDFKSNIVLSEIQKLKK